jgi:predicted SprT family Zn-dependent metalloprotease
LFFNGVLPKIDIEISRTKHTLGQFTYIEKTNTPLKIRISKYYNRTEFEIDQTLVHEMIHYYICFMGMKDSSSHGIIFKGMANEINSKSNFHIEATTLNTAPIAKKKEYRILCFTNNGRQCFARICKNFDYRRFVKKYNFTNVNIIITTIPEFDNWKECRSRLCYYYSHSLTDKLLASVG